MLFYRLWQSNANDVTRGRDGRFLARIYVYMHETRCIGWRRVDLGTTEGRGKKCESVAFVYFRLRAYCLYLQHVTAIRDIQRRDFKILTREIKCLMAYYD